MISLIFDKINSVGDINTETLLFDTTRKWIENVYINRNGILRSANGFHCTEFIPLDKKIVNTITLIGTLQAASDLNLVSFYNKDYYYISGSYDPTIRDIVVPENTMFIRLSAFVTAGFTNFSSNFLNSASNLILNSMTEQNNDDTGNIYIYILAQAYYAWLNGEKFPIAFFGDSTTDGVGTTGWTSANGHYQTDMNAGGLGKADYKPENGYTTVLEQLIQSATENSTARIYNAGYSGSLLNVYKGNMPAVFGNVYSDVKMIGIMYGINDRLIYSTYEDYYNGYYSDLEVAINWCYSHNIQPFIITTQAGLEPSPSANIAIRCSEGINSVVNRANKALAKKYTLEIIDMNSFGNMLLNYSLYNTQSIINDSLHFGNLGHQKEADYFFANICPRRVHFKLSPFMQPFLNVFFYRCQLPYATSRS
jgi:lysophospholipase L1-like esterase